MPSSILNTVETSYKPLIPEPLSTDTKDKTTAMERKKGYTISESDRRLIKTHAHILREALFSCMTELQVETAVAFARFLSSYGLTQDNYQIFLRLIMTNNPWVIDELLHDREPRLLFSTIQPDEGIIEAAFQTLFSRHPGEIYQKALEALLGIIESAYFDPDDGYRIRKLTIMDINALGKFLLKDEPQDHPLNWIVLDILDKITGINRYYPEQDKSILSKHAFNVRYAYFDRTRNLVDTIPHPLLVELSDRNSVQPADDFIELVTKRRMPQRDERGRFVKSVPADTSANQGEETSNKSPASGSGIKKPNADQEMDNQGISRKPKNTTKSTAQKPSDQARTNSNRKKKS